MTFLESKTGDNFFRNKNLVDFLGQFLAGHRLGICELSCCRCGSMRTTRSFTMRSRQRSKPFPRQFSAENLDLFLWQIMYFSLQTARICDLCCFCSVATNAKNVIVAATNCYCNHEKSAQPQFFFQLQLCGSGFHLTSSTSSRSLQHLRWDPSSTPLR